MRKSRHRASWIAVSCTLLILPAVVFAQGSSASQAAAALKKAFLALASGDVAALGAMIDADPGLLSAVDKEGQPLPYRALETAEPAAMVSFLISKGLSPFYYYRDRDRSLLFEAIVRADTATVRVIVEAMKSYGPETWGKAFLMIMQAMDALEAMSPVELTQSVAAQAARGAAPEVLAKRRAALVNAMDRFPEARTLISSILTLPGRLYAEASGCAGLQYYPCLDDGTIAANGFAPSFGLTVSALFLRSSIGDNGMGVAPLFSLGFYARAGDSLLGIGNALSFAAGIEFDILHVLYLRAGGGWLLASPETFVITLKDSVYSEASGYSTTESSLVVPLSGVILDFAAGLRFDFGAFSLSISFPASFRIGFPEVPAATGRYNSQPTQILMGFGIGLGGGLALDL